ncbi:MAG: hypothetical protein J6P98_00135 [Clostridia bacterium]|nr:hypothetical protein [Clostridia bacterium]
MGIFTEKENVKEGHELPDCGSVLGGERAPRENEARRKEKEGTSPENILYL